MGIGISTRRLAVLALVLFVAVALWAASPGAAGAAKLVGKDGKVISTGGAPSTFLATDGASRLTRSRGVAVVASNALHRT